MSHLVRHPLTRRRRLESACRDIEAVLVEQHPDVGPFASESPFVRDLLDEPGDRLHGLVHGLVEPAIQPNLLRQPGGTNRGPALTVPSDHLWGHGHRQNVLGRGRSAEPESEAKGEAEGEAEGETQGGIQASDPRIAAMMRPGPWTPVTRIWPMSADLLGPEWRARTAGRPSRHACSASPNVVCTSRARTQTR